MKRKAKFKSEKKEKSIRESQKKAAVEKAPPRGACRPEPESIETEPDNDHVTMETRTQPKLLFLHITDSRS